MECCIICVNVNVLTSQGRGNCCMLQVNLVPYGLTRFERVWQYAILVQNEVAASKPCTTWCIELLWFYMTTDTEYIPCIRFRLFFKTQPSANIPLPCMGTKVTSFAKVVKAEQNWTVVLLDFGWNVQLLGWAVRWSKGKAQRTREGT